MPEEGIELSPSSNILSDDEIMRLATLFVKSGVAKIRLTGGEPTVRKGLVELVGASCYHYTYGWISVSIFSEGRLNELRPLGLRSIAMTTNGLALHRKLPQLIANGLTHLNLRCSYSIQLLSPVIQTIVFKT